METITNDFWETVNWRNVTPKEIENAVRLGANINYRYEDAEKTLLHVAAKAEYPDDILIVKKMIELGADIHAVDEYGRTPLFSAINENVYSIFMIETLLEFGADVNAKSVRGETSLHEALTRNVYPVVIQFLLEYGADVNARCDDGVTPLHLACNGDLGLTLVHALFTDDIDVNAQNNLEETPLFWAVCHDPNVVQFLIDRGANVNAIDHKGQTPLDHVLEHRGDTAPVSALERIEQRELDRTIQILRNAGGKTGMEMQDAQS